MAFLRRKKGSKASSDGAASNESLNDPRRRFSSATESHLSPNVESPSTSRRGSDNLSACSDTMLTARTYQPQHLLLSGGGRAGPSEESELTIVDPLVRIV